MRQAARFRRPSRRAAEVWIDPRRPGIGDEIGQGLLAAIVAVFTHDIDQGVDRLHVQPAGTSLPPQLAKAIAMDVHGRAGLGHFLDELPQLFWRHRDARHVDRYRYAATLKPEASGRPLPRPIVIGPGV